MSKLIICPNCLGSKTIVEQKENEGFISVQCPTCKGKGKVTEEIEEIFLNDLITRIHNILNDESDF